MIRPLAEQQAWERAVQMHTRVLDSMIDGISLSDESGIIRYTNPAAERMYGYEPGELIGSDVAGQLAAPETRNHELGEALRRDGVWTGERLNRRKDGSFFQTRARITVIEIDGRQYRVCVEEEVPGCPRSYRQAEEKEQRFAAFLDRTTDIVYTTGVNGAFVEPQPAWEAYSGQHWPEYQGQGGFDAIHPEDRDSVREKWQAATAARQVFSHEFRLWRARCAEHRYVHSRAVPILDRDGSPREWLGTITDIHERRLAEEQSHELSEMLRSLIRASPLPIVALTHDGNITHWNPAAERVFGWTLNEVAGKPLPFIPEEKRAEHRAMRERDLAGEGFTNREIRRRRKDGSAIELSVSTAPVRDLHGRVVGIMSVYIDITERKRMEAELRKSEAKFRGLVEQSPISTQILSLEGRVVMANSAWERLWGVTVSDIVGTDVLDQSQLVERGVLPHALNAATGETVHLPERPFSLPRGTVWLRSSAYPVRDETGAVRQIVLVQEDVTERRRVEQALRISNEELRQSNLELEQFAYVASHDLQEPLRTVNLYAQLLLRNFPQQDQRVREYAAYVQNGVARMERLIQDLLAYSRSVHTLRQDGTVAVTDLSLAVADAMAMLEDRLRESRASVSTSNLPSVRAEPGHMSQLFQNLLSNAVKYKQPGVEPCIEITAAQSGGEHIIQVTDNGIGFEQEYAEQVFGLFKRLHRDDYAGTGLGLAICKRIVERYGGRIWAESSPGSGAKFYFSLPEAPGS